MQVLSKTSSVTSLSLFQRAFCWPVVAVCFGIWICWDTVSPLQTFSVKIWYIAVHQCTVHTTQQNNRGEWRSALFTCTYLVFMAHCFSIVLVYAVSGVVVQSPWPNQHTHTLGFGNRGRLCTAGFPAAEPLPFTTHTHQYRPKIQSIKSPNSMKFRNEPNWTFVGQNLQPESQTVHSQAVSITFESDVITWMQVNSSDGGWSERGI